MAANGLRYNRFHTTALCAPTRSALLTGRNHHSVGMGTVTEIATVGAGVQLGPPEQQSAAGRDAETERLQTAQFGKCHEVPVFQNSPIGPFDMWPTGVRL